MLAESNFRSKFKSKFTSRFDRGLLMAGTVMASRKRVPHWVTLGASADLDFIGERYSVEGLTPAFTDIPGVSVSRASTGTAIVDGILTEFGDDTPRIGDDGLLVENAATNKAYAGSVEPSQLLTPTSQTAFETAFPDLDAFDAGAGALFGVVDRSADIAGTEIAGLLPNGRVYVIDNTEGSGNSLINFAGLTGNTNQHTSSAWIWSDTATGINEIGLGLNPSSAKNLTSNVTASPQRFSFTETPADANRKLQVSVSPGHRVYFVLPQLEESSTATSYIPTEGSAVTRAADSVSLTDLDALGLTSAVLSGGYTVVLDLQDWAWGGGAEHIFGIGTTVDNRFIIFRRSSDGALVVRVDDGSTISSATYGTGTAPTSGRLKLAVAFDPVTGLRTSLNGASATSDDPFDGEAALGGSTALHWASHSGSAFVQSVKERRRIIIPRAVSDAELQQLSDPS